MHTIAGLDDVTVAGLITQYRLDAEKSISTVKGALGSQAQQLAEVVAGFRRVLFDALNRAIIAHGAVVAAIARDPNNPALQAALGRVTDTIVQATALAQGYAAYERPADQAEAQGAVHVGVAPAVVLVVAIAGVSVIALSITGVCWAVVHYEHAKALQSEIALIEKDASVAPLLADLNRSKNEGEAAAQLDTARKGGTGLLLGLGLAATAAGFGLWWASKRGAR